MPSELDRRYDAALAEVTGPGGTLVIGKDERGQAIVTNFPATLPGLFRTFCALHPDNEAIVAGDERLTFAELDANFRMRGARPCRARDRQGRPRRHRDAQLPVMGRRLHGAFSRPAASRH